MFLTVLMLLTNLWVYSTVRYMYLLYHNIKIIESWPGYRGIHKIVTITIFEDIFSFIDVYFKYLFAPIATAHPYCTHKFTCHIMHQVCALSTKMNNDRADGHCYSFTWI